MQLTTKIKSFVVLLVMCVSAPGLFAQESQWQNLAGLQYGTKIQVVERSLKSLQGTFMSFSDTQLTIGVKEKEITIARDDIYRVNTIGTKRKRNALIGLAAGVGMGAAFVACCIEKESGAEGAAAGSVGLFAAIGVGMGAAFPAGGTTVYRDETRKAARQH